MMQREGAGVTKKPSGLAGPARVPLLRVLPTNFGDKKSFSKRFKIFFAAAK